ncbi:hypothetical protein LTS02_007186 [Friedmanniomyces endolithicus]|nr:hypothetical protein LTS02_007186 [Friedmanniomyces endolithicus]
MLGKVYETAGFIPATVKTKYGEMTAVLYRVKAWFKNTVPAIRKSPKPETSNTITLTDAPRLNLRVESRAIDLPHADEHIDRVFPGWLSARHDDRVHQKTPVHHVNITAPSPAYAKFCREREDRRAKFQACLDYGSIEDLAEFETGLIEDGLLQDRRAVLAYGETKVEESGERDLAAEEGVTIDHATGSDLANNGTEQHQDREISEHQDATEPNKEQRGLDVDHMGQVEEVEREMKHEDVIGG